MSFQGVHGDRVVLSLSIRRKGDHSRSDVLSLPCESSRRGGGNCQDKSGLIEWPAFSDFLAKCVLLVDSKILSRRAD